MLDVDTSKLDKDRVILDLSARASCHGLLFLQDLAIQYVLSTTSVHSFHSSFYFILFLQPITRESGLTFSHHYYRLARRWGRRRAIVL